MGVKTMQIFQSKGLGWEIHVSPVGPGPKKIPAQEMEAEARLNTRA